MTLVLSAVETEQLRDLRARLNRVPKGSLGDKSVAPLSRGFFDLAARVGLSRLEEASAAGVPAIKAVAEADMGGLRRAVTALHALKEAQPPAFRRSFDEGLLQAVVTRRLVLGGRERGGT